MYNKILLHVLYKDYSILRSVCYYQNLFSVPKHLISSCY